MQNACVFDPKPIVIHCRSVSYTVNNYHKHHVTVLAEVVPVALELSMEELVLKPSYGLPSDAGRLLRPTYGSEIIRYCKIIFIHWRFNFVFFFSG